MADIDIFAMSERFKTEVQILYTLLRFKWRLCRIPQLKWRWGPFTFKKYASKKRGIPISGGPLALPAILSRHICISAIAISIDLHGRLPCKLIIKMTVSVCSSTVWAQVQQGGVVCRQKKGGRKSAVTAQCEVRLKMATAGLRQISRSCSVASQNLYFFRTWRQKF